MTQVHIRKEQFEQLQMGILTEKEKKLMLGHCNHCDVCAGQLVDSFAQNQMVTAPKGMKGRIIRKSIWENQISKQLQLFFYGLKVTAAAVGTCALFWTVSLGPVTQISIPAEKTEISRIEKVNKKLYQQKKLLNETIYNLNNQLFGGG